MNILVFEPNNYHFEILPGFVNLLEKIGCQVTLLMHEHSSIGDEFAFAKCTCNTVIYENDAVEALMEELDRNKYDAVFFTSFDYSPNGSLENIVDIISNKHINLPYFGCYHNLNNLYIQDNLELLEAKKIVTLSNCNDKTYVVNPNYFCEEQEVGKKANEKSTFVSIGVSNNRKEIEHAIDVLAESTDNFEVRFIGNSEISKKARIKRKIFYPICSFLRIKPYNHPFNKPIRKETLNLIHNLGKLKFEDMFDAIKSSDFIIMNLDQVNNPLFYKTCTSGAKQLSLGFLKPCIVERKVAIQYGFDESNAVIYDANLQNGIRTAVNMSVEEYVKMCQKLLELRNQIEEESISNLRLLVDDMLQSK